jgi:hypothetical protein
MKLSIAVFSLVLMTSVLSFAQETMVSPNATTAVQNIALKLDRATGKIELVNIQKGNATITQYYKLSAMELEIFDANGQYAGSLELKDFFIPANEVDKTEKVKVAKMRFVHTASGEELVISNVEFLK